MKRMTIWWVFCILVGLAYLLIPQVPRSRHH